LVVHATNPAVRIQIVGEDRRIHLAEPATGDVSIRIPPGKYSIRYWLGTSLVQRLPIEALRSSTVEIDWKVPETRRSSGEGLRAGSDIDRWLQCINVEARGRELAEIWLQILSTTTAAEHRRVDAGPDAWPRLFVSWPGARVQPIALGRASRVPVRQHVVLGRPTTQGRMDVAVLGRSPDSLEALVRPVPLIDGLTPHVSLTRRESSRQPDKAHPADAVLLGRDWRLARYRLQLIDSDQPSFPLLEDAVAAEALIDRLGEPGRVPLPEEPRRNQPPPTNVLATVASWLLAARWLDPLSGRAALLPQALRDRIVDGGSCAALPDVHVLRFLLGAAESSAARGARPPFELGTPVFAESWRALCRVPLAVWQEHEIISSSATRLAASSAAIGGVWFGWNATIDRDEVLPESARLNLSFAIGDALNAVEALAEIVQASLAEPVQSKDYFTELMEWGRRSPLERRILNYFTAPLGPHDEAKGRPEQILEDLDRELAIPLPFVADAVRNLERGTDNTSTPTRNPIDAPSGASFDDQERTAYASA
jgi:hypothetical protein